MALAGFSHTGTPGGAGGLGADIRAAMAGDAGFTTNWTVHPEVLFGAGTTERSYWVCEHSSGLQVLFGVGNGNTIGGGELWHPTWYNSLAFNGTTDQTVWVALDPNGGASGSNSFYDNLYNNALDPDLIGFWNQTEKTEAVRVNEWFEGVASCTIWFVYDTALAHLFIYSNGNGAGRLNSISTLVLSNEFVDDTKRAVDDRLPKRHGMLAVEPDTDAGGNDVVGWARYLLPGGGLELDEVSDSGNIILDYWRFTPDFSNAVEPDADGEYITSTIPMNLNRDGGSDAEPRRIIGEINRDLARFNVFDSPPLGKRRAGGALMAAQSEMMWGWVDALGDIIP